MGFWDSLKKGVTSVYRNATPVGIAEGYINNRQGTLGGGIRGAMGNVPIVGNIQNSFWGSVNGTNSKPQTISQSQGYNETGDIMNQIKGQQMTFNPVQGEGANAQLMGNLQYKGGSNDLASLLQENQANEMFARQDAAKNAQGALDQTRATSAMRGGWNNPALAQRSSLRDTLMAQQGASRDALMQQQKIKESARGIDNQNIDRLMGAMGTVNQYDQNKMDLLTKLSASKQMADATRASGKDSGGFLSSLGL